MDDADAVQRSAATGAAIAGAWAHPFGDVFPKVGTIETVLAPSLRPGAKELEQLAALQRRLAATVGEGLLALREITIDAQGRLVLRCDGFEGEPLHCLVARARPSAARMLAILHGIARALTAAHAGGVLHRALSPAAVLVGRDDEVRVLDFGLGMLLRQDSPAAELRLDPITPERVLGLPPSASDDIYAFGCLGYLLATGEPPLVDDDAVRLRRRHAIEDPPRLSRRPDLAIDRAFAKLLDRCLAKDPEDRPASMAAVLEALPPLPAAGKPADAPAKPATIAAVVPPAPTRIVPPKPATTPAPPKLATTPAPPKLATTPAPPKPATTISPPATATTPAPPKPATAIAPPATATTPAPPKLATTPAPPKLATTIAPPKPATAIAPPEPAPPEPAPPEPAPPPVATTAAREAGDEVLGAPPDPGLAAAPTRAAPATDRVIAAPPGALAPRSPWWQRTDVRIGAAALLLLGVLATSWSVARTPDGATHGESSALAAVSDARTATAAGTASVSPTSRPQPPVVSTPRDDAEVGASPIAAREPSATDDGDHVATDDGDHVATDGAAPIVPLDDAIDDAVALADADEPVDATVEPGTPKRIAELLAGAASARRAGRRAEAAHAFKEVAELDPDNLQALEALTRLAFDRADFTQAVRWGKRAVAAAPGSARNRIALGDAYFKLGRRADAKAQYEKAERLGHALAKRRLAMLDG
ncbi:MAG: protein kinase [Deltaproteobacteria bacterium]|nr:protein kinase [Deltaproteobacteria bacterium]